MIDSLVIGNGEIGSAIFRVLQKRQDSLITKVIDIKDSDFNIALEIPCKTLHICFTYSSEFEKYVIEYAKKTKAELVIIHSTVQIGTTTKILEALNISVVHSPVQGQHPELEESILYFDKFVGTKDVESFRLTTQELSNVLCVKLESPEASELGKLLSTAYYGLCIVWHREMKRICDEMNISFKDAVTKFNLVYNEGYKKFKPNVIRPILTPPSRSIGGHCVIPNARLLEEKMQSQFLKLIS